MDETKPVKILPGLQRFTAPETDVYQFTYGAVIRLKRNDDGTWTTPDGTLIEVDDELRVVEVPSGN